MRFISRIAVSHNMQGWKSGFILFLAVLLPMTPLLAQVQEDSSLSAGRKASPGQPLEGGLAAYFASRAPSPSNRMAGRLTGELFAWRGTTEGRPATGDACTAGKADAGEQTGGTLWFALGLVTGPWGVLGAYLINPSTSDINLKGKSKSFTSAYTSCYIEEARSIHTKWAWIGFGTAVAVLFIVFAALLMNNKPS